MSTSNKRYVVLAAVDESSIGDAVVAQAAALARATPGAEIHLVHAAERSAEADATDAPFNLERHRTFLDARARDALQLSGVHVVGHLLERHAVSAILQTAASLDADIVIVGTEKRGLERLLLGSVARKVVDRAACPVLVVRPKDHVASHAPDIEPPCADCLREQEASHGNRLWCARHSQHHPRMHLHYEAPSGAGFGAGSNLIRP
jgi:nucleotide-binding universal stress UspA family protein